MTDRLSAATLPRLPQSVATPTYDRQTVTPGIVHLGVGAFHRAHQAVFIDDCLNRGETQWGIIAASLRSPDTRDAIEPQDNLYTFCLRDGQSEHLRIIGSIMETIVAPEDPERLVERLSDPRVLIVTLTVTEKGYLTNLASRSLLRDHPDILHDLENPVRLGGGGNDPVHHGAGAGDIGFDERGQFRVGKCDFIDAYWREVGRTLDPAVDGAEFAAGLRERFANPSLQHKTMQIASDASQKVPLRILGPLRELLAEKAECRTVIFAIALWIRSCADKDERGQPITILDPAFKEWDAPEQLAMTPDAVVDRFLIFERTFGSDLPRNEAFASTLKASYRDIREHGAIGAIGKFLTS